MATRPKAPPADQLLRLLLEQGQDYALFLMTPDGLITDWFHGAELIFGYTAEEMVGQNSLRLFTHEDVERGAAQHEFDLAASDNRSEDNRWHVRCNGTRFWGAGILLALKEAGKVV